MTYAQDAAYNAAGQLTALTLLGGGRLAQTYDPRTLRLTRLQGPGLDLSYAYDPVGNVRALTDTARAEAWAFAYDELDRLIAMQGPVTGTWTLDAGGRWLQRTEGGQTWVYDYGDPPAAPPASPGSYRVYLPLVTQGGVRCLGDTWAAAWASTAAGRGWRLRAVSDGTAFTYDANGNVLSRTVGGLEWRYVYDPENRLTEVWRGSTRLARYRYDPDGNRVKREVAGAATVVLAEDVELHNGGVRKRYRLGGTLVAVREGNTVDAVVADPLGSLLVLAQGGSVVGRTRYLPYGAIREESGVWITDRRFTGQRWEAALGLYDYNARFYDPTQGRFLQPDPLISKPYRPAGLEPVCFRSEEPCANPSHEGHDGPRPAVPCYTRPIHRRTASALKRAAPAAPRMVLWVRATNFTVKTGQRCTRPTTTLIPPPAIRSRRGWGRSGSVRTTMGWATALGRSTTSSGGR